MAVYLFRVRKDAWGTVRHWDGKQLVEIRPGHMPDGTPWPGHSWGAFTPAAVATARQLLQHEALAPFAVDLLSEPFARIVLARMPWKSQHLPAWRLLLSLCVVGEAYQDELARSSNRPGGKGGDCGN